ncbi:thioredoxin [Pseudoclavibacter chungangensis]|uniref:Thioredoxin n=1 Tax=Pseudoclavibacter chungangensis TaxID=587635 RepID=A0A7J5BPX0_9MICO|nr:thioredoxin [Pseudoclavibacter chungangensis]KAB1655394.1 thioredoxin [Pseudoclavibacter chungangensis]NYJ68350.1 thioredoxin 1 [Pseudoclavibacter chungangensis]
MSNAINATTATFQDEIEGTDKTVLVDFWAAWCGPCRQVSPILDQLAEEHENLKLVKVDVDAEPQLAAQYGITSIPAMKVFKDGKQVSEFIGSRPKAVLERELAAFL